MIGYIVIRYSTCIVIGTLSLLQLGSEYHDNQADTSECLEGHVVLPVSSWCVYDKAMLKLRLFVQRVILCAVQCPHSQVCPRLQRDDGTPCNFQAQFDGLVYIGSDNMVYRTLTFFKLLVIF